MNLSNIGVLADIFWYEIKNHAKNVKLDSFIVLPNHIHAILILNGGILKNGKRLNFSTIIIKIGCYLILID